MVSIRYWERLYDSEKAEYKKYSPIFIKALENSDAYDAPGNSDNDKK